MFKLVYYLLYTVLYPIYRFQFVGRENIPPGAAVLCANHTANIDAVFIILANGPEKNYGIIGKEELFRFAPLAALFRWLGGVPVKRGSGDVQVIRAGFSILKEGKKLLLFPEGTRVKQGMEPVRAKAGAAMFAYRNQVPLVPMYIPAGRKAFRKNTVVIGKPYMLECEGKPSHEQYQLWVDELMEKIQTLPRKELKQ